MSLALDSSSPAGVSTGSGGTITTASFTAPANSVLVAIIMSEGDQAATPPAFTISDSSSLTWTLQASRKVGDTGAQNGGVFIYTAIASTSVSRTISITGSGTNNHSYALKVEVWTGANTTSPVGATGSGSTTTQNITPTVYTSTQNNSRAIGAYENWNENVTPTSTDTSSFAGHIVGDFASLSWMSVHKAADTASSGTAVTINFNSNTTTNANWCAIELLPDPGIYHVQEIGSVSGNSVSSISVTPAKNMGSGNAIMVGVSFYRSSGTYPTCTVTDSKGNTYSTFYSYAGSAAGGPSLLVATCFNATPLTTTDSITATFSGGSGAPFSIMIADEWKGLSSTQDSSTVSANTINSRTVSFGTLTTTNVQDAVLVYISSFGNLTATSWSSGWSTNEFQSASPTLSLAWKIPNTAGSFSGTATISATEISDYALFAFKAPSVGGTNYTKNCTETVTLTDSRINTASKVLKENKTLTQSFLRSTSKSPFSESITLTPLYANQTQKTFSGSFTLTDPTIPVKIIGKSLTESTTLTQTFIRQTTKVLKETTNVVQTYTNQTMKVFQENSTLSDILTKSKVHVTNLNETLTLTQKYLNQTMKNLSETITLTQSLLKGLPAKIYSEYINFSNPYSLLFDGVNSYINTGLMGNFGSNLNKGFYCKFLCKTTSTTLGSILGSLNSGTGTSLGIQINGNNNGTNTPKQIRLYLRDDSSNLLSAQTPVITNLTDGNWHTVEIIINNASFNAHIYFDGIDQTLTYGNSAASFASFSNFSNPMVIGARNNGGSIQQLFNGILDSVMVGTTSGDIRGYYLMNEGTGTTTADSSGNGNTGTLSGSVLPQWTENKKISLQTGKIFTHTVTLTQSFIYQINRLFIETITLTSSLLKSTIIAFNETITLSSTFMRNSIKTFTEIVSITQTYLNQTTKLLIESLTISDVFAVLGKYKIFSETITVTNSFIKTISIVTRETITMVDTLKRSLTRTLIENISIIDTFIKQSVKMLLETVTISSVFNEKVLGKFMVETITLIDKYTSYLNGVRGLWGKAKKTLGSWTSSAKSSGIWTKVNKPSYPSK